MVWTTLRLSPSPDAFHESSDVSSAITRQEGHSPQSHDIWEASTGSFGKTREEMIEKQRQVSVLGVKLGAARLMTRTSRCCCRCHRQTDAAEDVYIGWRSTESSEKIDEHA